MKAFSPAPQSSQTYMGPTAQRGPHSLFFFPSLDRQRPKLRGASSSPFSSALRSLLEHRRFHRLLEVQKRRNDHYDTRMVAGGGGGDETVVRVLVVDDSPVDRRIVELLLRNHNKGGATAFHVTTVDSGKKAMELLRLKEEGKLGSSAAAGADEQAIDIVLTDYCMPEMTGYDLLKAIKALSSPNPIPVVVMSSENEPQRISRCLTAGAEDFILKPLKAKDIQRLRNCYTEQIAHCRSLSRRKLLPSDHIAKMDIKEQRSQLKGLSMVQNASSSELPHYFQFLFKFVLLAYAVLCLSELLHRWSNGCFFSLW